MTTTTVGRIGAIAAAVAIAATGGSASSTASARTGQHGTDVRPCFMVQSHWNEAEGPQPTCPTPTWVQARSSGTDTATQSVAQARITDFMP